MSRYQRIKGGLRRLPAGIWALGLTSLFMDISSELVHSLLPVFLATGLGASMVTIGFIEGVAEATAAITKVFSGALSDYLGKRKPLVVLGYGLGAVTKPFFPLAASASLVFAARFVDRIGRASAVPRGMLWWPTSRHASYVERRTASVSRWTRSAPFWVHCSR